MRDPIYPRQKPIIEIPRAINTFVSPRREGNSGEENHARDLREIFIHSDNVNTND